MKIEVTAVRECCEPGDLKTYRGESKITDAKFCQYCGQMWHLKRFTDAAGDSDSEYVRFIPQIA